MKLLRAEENNFAVGLYNALILSVASAFVVAGITWLGYHWAYTF